MITQAINLNLIPGQVLPRVNVSQYDYGSRTLEFKLFNGNQSFTLTSSMTANISGTKADMHGFEYDATVDTTNQKIVADLTQQMTATAGDVTCELIIKKSGERLGTCNFVISVEKAALGDDAIISDTELPVIIAEAAAQMEAAAQSASEAASSAQAAEESADIAEIYGAHPPYIGVNGNWYVYNVTTQQYEDSGVKAQGPLSGLTDVEITNAQDGQEITYDGTTQKWKNTSKIQTLTNQVKDMNNVYGSKNLLPYPYYENRSSLNGITYVINSDGSVTFNGTATATAYFNCTYTNKIVDFGDVNFSSRSNSNTFYKAILKNGSNNIYLNYNASNKITAITITSGTVCENLTVYPMIRLASITDDTYVPYAKTNQQLTEDTTALFDNLEVNGAVNLCENVFTSQVINDVTFTKNSNGSLTVRGTASGNISTTNYSGGYIFNTTLKAGTYKLSVGQATKRIYYRLNDGSAISVPVSGYITFTVDTDDTAFKVWFYCNSGVVANETYYPMLTVASYNGDYVPYAKSNKELTDEKLDISSLKTITAASSDFADFKTRIAAL